MTSAGRNSSSVKTLRLKGDMPDTLNPAGCCHGLLAGTCGHGATLVVKDQSSCHVLPFEWSIHGSVKGL